MVKVGGVKANVGNVDNVTERSVGRNAELIVSGTGNAQDAGQIAYAVNCARKVACL